jgi:uncharacterized protein YeeX (DUF496 family)
MYEDFEIVYKPAVQRLRDDMKRIRDLAREIALLAASHDYPEIKTGTEIAKGTAKSPRDVYEQVDLDHERKGD